MMKPFRKAAIVASGAVLLASLSACSSSNKDDASPNSSEGAANQTVKLTYWTNNGPGLDGLIKQYQQDHPNVKIDVQVDDSNLKQNLLTALSAGSGAPDISILTVDDIPQFKNEEYFYNLKDFGADQLKNDYLETRWKQGTSDDGSFIYGIPTDSGPMAMMYRVDLFQKAGLPTDRDSVSKLMATWDDFYKVGQTIKEKTGKPLVPDSYFGAFLPKIQQAGEYTIFDKDGKLTVDTNPAVKEAWDYSVKLAQAGLSAKQPDFSNDWKVGLVNGDFATMFAPPWMLGVVKQNAPDAAGKWDIAMMPGGSANWGGSFLVIPKQSKNAQAAYDFIKWILAPEQQLSVYKTNGNFPSTPSVYSDEAFKGKKDEFFNDAPVGEIYSKAAEKVTLMDSIHSWADFTTAAQTVLPNVENGADPEKTWSDLVKQIKSTLSR